MANYVNYDDFCALYPEKITAEQFDQYCPAAEAYINLLTHDRAKSATGYKAERVKQAVCAAILEAATLDAAKSATGARLTSVANDGYTESYGVAGDAGTEMESIRAAAVCWLSGTGLVGLL